ncbi:MAG: tetratricopeptide repeat protein, partial [Saprospiraceae bacterium]|nr:tetratricopeptide repeat protein [Saprospiraceae bacterium]
MKNSSFIILFITCTLMIVGCQVEDQVASQRSISPEIPALLTRGSKIQMGKEWTNVQNAYAKLCKDLRKDDGNSQSALSLAMLFIQEARVTGEHGHYYPAALQMINNILKSGSPDDDLRFRSLSAQAGVFLSLHQFDAALEIAKEAVKLNNYNAQIYGVLVDAHVELGDYDMAVRMADKMVSIRPDLRSYSRVSYLREIHGDLEGAIDAMKLAVSAGYPTYEETAWAKLTL